MTNIGESNSTPAGQLIGSTHHGVFAAIPSTSLRVGSMRRLGSPPCLWDRDETGETYCCIVEVTSKDITVQTKRAFLLRGRDVLVQDVLPRHRATLRRDRFRL